MHIEVIKKVDGQLIQVLDIRVSTPITLDGEDWYALIDGVRVGKGGVVPPPREACVDHVGYTDYKGLDVYHDGVCRACGWVIKGESRVEPDDLTHIVEADAVGGDGVMCGRDWDACGDHIGYAAYRDLDIDVGGICLACDSTYVDAEFVRQAREGGSDE